MAQCRHLTECAEGSFRFPTYSMLTKEGMEMSLGSGGDRGQGPWLLCFMRECTSAVGKVRGRESLCLCFVGLHLPAWASVARCL